MKNALKLNKTSYIDNIHSNSKGWITGSVIDKNGYSQWHYKYAELNTLFIDLDYYKTKDQVLMNLEKNYFNQSIPVPNYVVDNGRGLYLIWLINTVPSQALPLWKVWKAVQEYFYKILKEFGADRQALDATRILRVPGSKNSKSNTIVSVIDEYNYIYDLREIKNGFLPELKPYEKKKGRPSKINYIYRERSLYFGRIQDIIKLCELREYDLKGHRELILFLYRYYLCSFTEDIEKALNDVLELNSMFRQPLKESEVIRATRSAERCYLDKNKQYKYKNETLIELLEIIEDEERYMKIIISKKEYRRRENVRGKKNYQEQLKAQGKFTEKEKISQRREKIKDLLAKGLTQKEIYTLMKISKRTCINDVNFLRRQGLI